VNNFYDYDYSLHALENLLIEQYEFQNKERVRKEKREQALAKLTDEEKKLLGLTD
jgi:hypothetical protein